MENRGEMGRGLGAANTNCTFQPELHVSECVCVCWPQLLFFKGECLGQIKKSQQNYLPVMKFASILFLLHCCYFHFFLVFFFLFAAFADAKRFAILFRLPRPSKAEEEECKVFLCS